MSIKEKKTKQLGMNPGTASNRLKKSILFNFAKMLGYAWCYQCATEIKDIDKFTIEHKTPWLDSEDPIDNFFNLDNIAFHMLVVIIVLPEQNMAYHVHQ